jgi:signal transduction histidine kinase
MKQALTKAIRRRFGMVLHGRSGYTGLPLAFKGLLILGVVTIAVLLAYSTQKMVRELKASEARLANAYAGQWKRAAESTDPGEIAYLFDQIISKSDFPIVVTDPQGDPLYWRGLKGIDDRDTSVAMRQRIIALMAQMSVEYPPVPIVYEGTTLYKLHYGNFELIRAASRFPYIMLGLTTLFLVIAYVSFSNIKRAEQRYIWVGMAKETAHQLGTPLMSMLGWLEKLQEQFGAPGPATAEESPDDISYVLTRMRADVARLNRVAQRFSKIGSDPDRKTQQVEPVVQEVVAYFRERLPFQGRGVQITLDSEPAPPIPVNPELVAWVLENLIKNAMESVDAKVGKIALYSAPHPPGGVRITVTDNGRGIPGKQQKRIFHPGFTTKKRGWGLGLTLARRIVMEYHGGDLYLDESVPNQSTRFVIELPG